MRALQDILDEAIGNHLVALQDIGNEHSRKLDVISGLLEKISSSTSQTNSTVQAAATASSSGTGTSAINNYVKNGMSFGGAPNQTSTLPTDAGGSGGGGGGSSYVPYEMINFYAKNLAKLLDRYQKSLWTKPGGDATAQAAYLRYRDGIPSAILSEVENKVGYYMPTTVNGEVRARSGTQFTIPGHTGVDSKVIPIRATPGEEVTVRTKKQQLEARGDGGGGDIYVEVNIKAQDADSFRQSEVQMMREFAVKLGGALKRN